MKNQFNKHLEDVTWNQYWSNKKMSKLGRVQMRLDRSALCSSALV